MKMTVYVPEIHLRPFEVDVESPKEAVEAVQTKIQTEDVEKLPESMILDILHPALWQIKKSVSSIVKPTETEITDITKKA